MKVNFPVVLVVLGLVICSDISAEIRVLPLVNADLSGGNSFFNGKSSSFGGNLSLDLVPVIRFSDKLSVLPRYSGKYTGSFVAMEIQDEGYLYQQIQDNIGSMKFIYKISDEIKFKTAGGYIKELLRETKDEQWGDGLYDYDSIYGETEIEKRFANSDLPFLIGAGYRFYTMRFPNYESLASKTTSYTELIGEDVLDTDNNKIFVNSDIYLTRDMLSIWGYSYVQSKYLDQKIVTQTGGYSTEKRTDQIHTVKCNINYAVPESESKKRYRKYLGMNLEYKLRLSNQNHFDTDAVQFIENYYSYYQLKCGPSITFKFIPSDLYLSFGYELSYKKYTDRPIQDTDGYYGEDKLSSSASSITLLVSYPLKPYLKTYLSGGYKKTSSDMEYETLYRYNYNSANYLIGISYEY